MGMFCTPTGIFVCVGVALGWVGSLLVFGPTTNGTWQIWRSNRTANSASQPWPLLLWILNKPLRVQNNRAARLLAALWQLNLLTIINKVGGELGNPLSFTHFSLYLTQTAQFFWPFLQWIENHSWQCWQGWHLVFMLLFYKMQFSLQTVRFHYFPYWSQKLWWCWKNNIYSIECLKVVSYACKEFWWLTL